MEKMNFKVYVHGRPQGQSIYPKDGLPDQDTLYLKSFLDSTAASDAKDALLTDILGNTVYYTYIRRKDVFEHERGKGYFAITLRCDNSVGTYVSELYRLLGEIYTKCCSEIIGNEKGMQIFLIRGFEEKSKVVENILSEVTKLITTAFGPFFEKLGPTNYDTRQKKIKQYSSKDVDSIQFREDMKMYRLVISTDYPSYHIIMATDAQNKSNKIANLSKSLQQREETIKDCEKSIKECEEMIKKHEETIKSKDEEIKGLKNKYSKYNDEDFKNYVDNKKAIHEYIRIEPVLIKLSHILVSTHETPSNHPLTPKKKGPVAPKPDEPSDTSPKSKSKKARYLLLSGLIIVALMFGYIWLNNGDSKKVDVVANIKATTEYKSLLEENQSLKEEINAMKTELDRFHSAVVCDGKNKPKYQATILMDGAHLNEVTVGKTYKLSLQNNMSDNYKYTVRGDGQLCENAVSVYVKKVGMITITCENLDTKETIAELQVTANYD